MKEKKKKLTWLPSAMLGLVAVCTMSLTGCSSAPAPAEKTDASQIQASDKFVSADVVANAVPQDGQDTVAANLVMTYERSQFLGSKQLSTSSPVTATLLKRQNGWFCMANNQKWKFTAGNLHAEQLLTKPQSIVADTSTLSKEEQAQLDSAKDQVIDVQLVTDQSTAAAKDGATIDAHFDRTHEHEFTYDRVDYKVSDSDKQGFQFVERQNGWFDFIGDDEYKFAAGAQVAQKLAQRPSFEQAETLTEKIDEHDKADVDPRPYAREVTNNGATRNLVLRTMMSNTTKFKYETLRYPLGPDTIVESKFVPEQGCWDQWVGGKLYRIHQDDARTIDVLAQKPRVPEPGNPDHTQLLPGNSKPVSDESFAGGPLVPGQDRRDLIVHQTWETEQEFQYLDYSVVSSVQTDWVPQLGNSCVQYKGMTYRIFGDGTLEVRSTLIPVDVTGTSDQPFMNMGGTEVEPDFVGLPLIVDSNDGIMTQWVRHNFEMPAPPYLLKTWHVDALETFAFDEGQEGYFYVVNGYTLAIPLPGSTYVSTGRAKYKAVQTPEGFRFPRVLHHKGDDGTSEGHTIKTTDPNDNRGDSVDRLAVPRKTKHTDGYGNSFYTDKQGSSSGYAQGGSSNTSGASGYTQEMEPKRKHHESSGYTQESQPSGYNSSGSNSGSSGYGSSGYSQPSGYGQSSGYGEGGSSNSFGASGYGQSSGSSGSSGGGHHRHHH